jgi:TolB-like protein/Flp pilus assembly protein TadD
MSVAVLDFDNLSRDTSDTYLSEGLTEELTSQLGQLERLRVASRTAVRRLRNASHMPLPDISRALNVAYLVNGSVRRSGQHLRVTVELLRAATGAQVWSSQYDRSEQDLLNIQEAVANAVATAVAGRLLPAERTTLANRPTRSPDAYDAYLRARVLYGEAVPVRQPEAVALLERAVAIDSGFATAWALLSRVQSNMFWFYVDRSNERLERAKAAANRAASLAPNAAETHIALGYIHYWGSRDYGRALQEFSAALVARPNDPEVHAAIANVARRQGSWDQSLASRTRAIELDPQNRSEIVERGLTLLILRRFDEAEQDFTRALNPLDFLEAQMFAAALALERDGNLQQAAPRLEFLAAHPEDFVGLTFHDPGALMPIWRASGPHQAAILVAAPQPTAQGRALHYLMVGQTLGAQGRRADAAAAYDSVRSIVEVLLTGRPLDDGFHAQLSLAYMGLGRCDDAVREAERAVELLPVSADALTGPQRLQNLAEVDAGCGRADQALDRLTNLLSIPSFVTRTLLKTDPAYLALRADARFSQLIGAN